MIVYSSAISINAKKRGGEDSTHILIQWKKPVMTDHIFCLQNFFFSSTNHSYINKFWLGQTRKTQCRVPPPWICPCSENVKNNIKSHILVWWKLSWLITSSACRMKFCLVPQPQQYQYFWLGRFLKAHTLKDNKHILILRDLPFFSKSEFFQDMWSVSQKSFLHHKQWRVVTFQSSLTIKVGFS